MNLKCFCLGKLSDGKAQLAWPGFKLETGSRGWGDALLSLGFMAFKPWLYANIAMGKWSCYTFVAEVIVVLINTLGMC